MSSLSSRPIDSSLIEIVELVKQNQFTVLTAEPGSGKTTRLPPALLEALTGQIVVLEPRRLAAVGAAQFVSQEQGWSLGKEVGYKVRWESQSSAQTRLVYMTEATLLRQLHDDPELSRISCVVLDEFHERSVHQDVLLGLIKQLQDLGSPIKLVIMSATLNAQALLDYFGSGQHIHVPGTSYPLTIEHSQTRLETRLDGKAIDRFADIIIQQSRRAQKGILVFLPGMSEINRVQASLFNKGVTFPVLALHGSLALTQQREVLEGGDEFRVILSTNVAEASVTVPGIDFVIDSGLQRTSLVHLKSGFTRLETQFISKFSGTQRAGRAARLQPGTCLRLWTTHEEAGQSQESEASICRSDLSSTLLLLASLGERDFEKFAWFEKPPSVLIKKAQDHLRDLKALDSDDRITPLGRELLKFPTEPRWALAILSSGSDLDKVAFLASVVAEGDPFKSRLQEVVEGSDTHWRWSLWQKQRGDSSGVEKRVQRSIEDFVRAAKGSALFDTSGSWQKALLLAFRDRLCRLRDQTRSGVMVGGRGVKLVTQVRLPSFGLFLAVDGVDLAGQAETQISFAESVSVQDVLGVFSDDVSTVERIDLSKEGTSLKKSVARFFRDLPLEQEKEESLPLAEVQKHWGEILPQRWPEICEMNLELKRWLARWMFFAQQTNQDSELPKLAVDQTLERVAGQIKTFSDLKTLAIAQVLESHLNWSLQEELRLVAPTKFLAPSGVQYDIQYSDTETPFVEVRIQELFGLAVHPMVGTSKQNLTFKLLAPNYRPVQQTQNIVGFWQGSYHDVRKELRGRYPKHPWPEDPLTSEPVKKGRSTRI